MDWLPVAVVIALAMGFNYTNGFHDAANAIATSISTRALTPRIALGMAAVFNLLGAFIGTKVAATVGKGIIAPPTGAVGLLIVASALVGAITWNLLTWWRGLPSSSSHALFGGMVGAELMAGAPVLWNGVFEKIIIPMVLSPVIGLILGYLIMTGILWLFRRQHPGRTGRGFRHAQTVSAAAMALGHGLQDAGKTMGIVVLALTLGGYQDGSSIPVLGQDLDGAGHQCGNVLRWVADHADVRPQDHSPGPAPGLRFRSLGGLHPLCRGTGLRCADLDHAHDHLDDHGCRCHKAVVRCEVGRGQEHRHGLGADVPRRGGLVAALAYAVTIPFH